MQIQIKIIINDKESIFFSEKEAYNFIRTQNNINSLSIEDSTATILCSECNNQVCNIEQKLCKTFKFDMLCRNCLMSFFNISESSFIDRIVRYIKDKKCCF